MQEGLIAEDVIRTTILNMEQGATIAPTDYIQFEPIIGMAPIDVWYNIIEIDDVETHISIRDGKLLNFNDWVSHGLIQKLNE